MQRLLLLIISLFPLLPMFGQNSVTGTWKTIDDGTGEAKSYVKIFSENGKLNGKITKILTGEDDARCEECSGKLKNKPVLGMQIINGLKVSGQVWGSGTILDPESGSEYKCKIWLDESNPNKLNVRGIHWTGLYRTQTWFRVAD